MPQNEKKPLSTHLQWLQWALVAFLIAYLFLFVVPGLDGVNESEIGYSEFKNLVARQQVAGVTLHGTEITARLRQPEKIAEQTRPVTEVTTRVPAIGDPELLPLLERANVPIRVAAETRGWAPMVVALLPWLLLVALIYLSYRGASRMTGTMGPGSELQKFLEGTMHRVETPHVTFADVAGQENAKRDVRELVDYLRDPERFRRLGAEVPRGVLLMGPPGTGKTLLARALAGEAGVPFFSISGSEFIEVFVGVGASRVRNLFAQAKANAPCIVFVDELDAVGRTRGTGLGGGHDEREQTLNQILAQMDGFEPHEAVIVLAATNRPDVLDPALLRPGRFDRHVILDLPDRNDRVAILKVHARKMPFDTDVDLERIAGTTPGFSGADLKNLLNEAAILAARDKAPRVSMRHVDQARDKMLLGAARSLAIQPEERRRLAVHEAGHAIVAYFLPQADPVYKVSIIPRGRSLGGTQQLPEHERHTLPEEYLRARLAVMLGGRVAERETLGSVSSGADDDIRQATALARAMVGRWGMSQEIGPVDLRDAEEHPFLGREMAMPRHFSEASAQLVDNAVRELLAGAETTARRILHNHPSELGRLVQALEQSEDLDRAKVDELLGPRSVQPSVREETRPAQAHS